MFEKLNQSAEQLAANVSRRGFLGKVSRSALALAGTVAALLALPSDAQAARGLKCCAYYICEPRWGCYWSFACTSGHCPKYAGFKGWSKVDSCDYCGFYG